MTDTDLAIAASELEVVYQRGAEPAISGVTFTLARGSGLLISAEEGSGATTLVRVILGLTVWGGEITVLGGSPGDPDLRRRIGYAPQGRTFAEGHTPATLLQAVCRIRLGRADRSAADEALARAGLPEPRRRARRLEVDELGRVALACAIAGEPELLVMDDPWEFEETHIEINRARDRGAAVLVTAREPGGFPALLGRTLTLHQGRRQ